MRRLWRGVRNTIFWSYERGSWPYDLMVVLIVLFVLFTPGKWFHDEPQVNGAGDSGVMLIAQDEATHTETYRIDSKLFPSSAASQDKGLSKSLDKDLESGPELERRTHEILSQSVDELKTHTFQIRSIEPIRGADNSILYYQVNVKR
ncbi:MAG TPA: hypothetical protein VKS00_03300 [Candidatus Acidoferrales bacterium]|nr:hypothetical protein [Candidatus Acidoferrales bacterium]